jgi:hypothetical protein
VDVAALIAWILTAGGGFFLLATWLAKGGARPQPTGGSRFPVPLIFGHFALAVVGLVVWIIYLASDSDAAAWTAFVLLVPVALLGFTMLARWIPTYRARQAAGGSTAVGTSDPAEGHFPILVVGAHGLLAVTTVVLVLLTALGVGES